jgi:UDP-N-acetylmuramoyl-L-alanyl-D-glutamate--2,6-diaminopimelate ligase
MTSIDPLLKKARRYIPKSLFAFLQPAYHASLALLGAIRYGFPARSLIVIGVTGTKGKSSTLEYLNAIFEEAGYATALISTIRFKVGASSRPNKRRMTMPGRMFIQKTLREALKAGCTVAFIEMTSEGARQHRDLFLDMNALIFTNLSPEHIESHGSLENYINAKLSIATRLAHSRKRPRIIVANADDEQGPKFLATPVERRIPFSLADAKPYVTDSKNGTFRFEGVDIRINFPGEFFIKNALAAGLLAREFGIGTETIKDAFSKLAVIPGRAEDVAAGRDFAVVIDYAHTPDSLEALYQAYDGHRRICVMGATGGGRDHWKRPKMGAVAESYCDSIILTNEDPYDEDPDGIVRQLKDGMTKEPLIIMDRRLAIRHAIGMARPGDAILITGKGTDPSICGPDGTQLPWSDAAVAQEELGRILS